MSKAGYTEVSLGETLQYEHRIKVNDFVRVLEQKGEIKTSPLKVFPGLELEFVIRKMAETCMVNNIQYLYSNATIIDEKNQQQQKKPGDLVFFIEILGKKNTAVGEANLAGEVKMNIDGKLMTIKLGDVEKKVYQAFTNGAIVIHSGKTVRRNHPYNGNQETFPGVFIYNTDRGWQDEVVTLELIFSLHHPGVLLMSQEVSVPKSLDSQETLPAMAKSIMLDSETADLTLRCDTKSFRVHKAFLCYRSVLSFFEHLSLLNINKGWKDLNIDFFCHLGLLCFEPCSSLT